MPLSEACKAELTALKIPIRFEEPMQMHTSFRIGGCADAFVSPTGAEDISVVIEFCRKYDVPCSIIGNGSNLLVADSGVAGVVIACGNHMNTVTVSDETVCAQAGVLLSSLAAAAARHGLSGLEALAGIPGTLGGAVYMNAGAYGTEMRDIVVETTYLDADCCVAAIQGAAHQFGYRRSCFTDTDNIIISSRMKLKKADPARIREAMAVYAARRRDKQPLEYPSAGSTFKRPEGHFAGALIEGAGLKGYRIGGAAVSQKHAGFIINTGNATASDVFRLIEHIKNEVYKKYGVSLECEVKLLGF